MKTADPRPKPGSKLVPLAVALLAAVVFLAACGGNPATSTTTGPAAVTTTGSAITTTTVPQKTMTPEDKAYTDQLKATALAANDLAKTLTAEGVKKTDPRAATLLALHARVQAISSRKFVFDKDLTNADVAFREMRSLLTQASAFATGDTAAAVKAAIATLAPVTAPPSQAQDQLTATLDKVVSELAPLLPPTNAGSSTTT
jgi:hypothetical protein